MKFLTDPKFMSHFHATMTLIWICLIPPSIFLWSESVPYLVLLSVWANLVGHWSAYAASRAEKKQDD